MPLVEFVAARLRELRARHGLTQEQAAVLLSADVRWYQRLELGVKDMRLSTVDRLAAMYGLEATEFLAATVSRSRVSAPAPTAPHQPRRKPTKAPKAN